MFVTFVTIFQFFQKLYLCILKGRYSSYLHFPDTLNPINGKSFCLRRQQNLRFLFGELSVYCPTNKKKPLKRGVKLDVRLTKKKELVSRVFFLYEHQK